MTKKIEAIIRAEKLNVVKQALGDIGIVGLTVFNVRGRGRGSGMQLQWRTELTSSTCCRACKLISCSVMRTSRRRLKPSPEPHIRATLVMA